VGLNEVPSPTTNVLEDLNSSVKSSNCGGATSYSTKSKGLAASAAAAGGAVVVVVVDLALDLWPILTRFFLAAAALAAMVVAGRGFDSR